MSSEITSRQFWIQDPGRAEVLRRPLPARQAGEVTVRALCSGISRGTESLVFNGKVPPSEYVSMRAPFQEGTLPGPVKYGYSSVGRVEDADAGARGGGSGETLVGQTVFCLYPHQDVYRVPASAVTPLPDGLPAGRAVLAANMETAVSALWDSGASAGDRIVVIGAGVVGLLIAHLCRRLPGSEVLVVDRSPAKGPAAAALGIPFTVEPEARADADVVFHASGSPAGLRTALGLASEEATIVEASWFGDESVCLPLGQGFHSRRLTIRSSQVGRLPAARAPRWDSARRMRLVLSLLLDDRLDALITGESPLDELPAVMRRLARDPGAELCHRIRY
jgi:threonine dehydrogenase-like Zn-dependent dehydrogenase